jgi:hypothetical protein
MKLFLKLIRWFFSNRFRETKERESLGEWTLLLSRMYPRLAVAMCFGCFMLIDSRNEISTPKQQNRNKEALKSAQQILDKVVKNLFPATLQAVKNEIRQLKENNQTEKVVPAPECRTSVKPLTTRQKTGRDKFSETIPKAFAPPESINMAQSLSVAILPVKTGKQIS